MKIIHLVPHIGIGGDITIIKSMVSAALANGHTVLVNGIDPQSAFGGAKNPFPLNQQIGGFFRSLQNLDLLFQNTDIIHVHSPICLFFAWLSKLLRMSRTGIVFTFHWPVADKGLRRLTKTLLFRLCGKLHVYSSDMVTLVRSRYRIPEHKIVFFAIGVSSEKFQPDSEEKSPALTTTTHGRVIGYLGRLSTEKNVNYLIRFLDENHLRYPDLRLHIVGGGALENSLKQLAAQSQAKDNILFFGHTNNPELLYPEFDLLVLPSTFESFALVIVEAAYCGIPSLRSDTEGSQDQIEEGVTGFLYSQADGYPAMESALRKILDRAWPQLPSIGAAAREHCLQLCDMDRFTRCLHELYCEVGELEA